MDTLHTVLRAIRGEDKPRRDHLTVFREFLANLDRAAKHAPAKRAPAKRNVKASKSAGRTAGKK